MTTENTLAVAPQPKTIKSLLQSEEFRLQVANALPRHLTPERFARVALTAINRTPALANCTQTSLFQCLLDLSAMGLEPDGRRAHLIPFKNNREGTTICTLIVDYKGIVELAQRSGVISNIHADSVCSNDEFEYDRGEVKKHKIDFRKPRGEAYAYYCIVRFKDGTEKAEVMTLDEIHAIRDRSQGYKAAVKYGKDHPWITDEGEMSKKTVFRRVSKWITLSPEIREHIEKDDEVIPVEVIKETVRPSFKKKEEIEDAIREVIQEQAPVLSGSDSDMWDKEDEIPMEVPKFVADTPQKAILEKLATSGFSEPNFFTALSSFGVKTTARTVQGLSDKIAESVLKDWCSMEVSLVNLSKQ